MPTQGPTLRRERNSLALWALPKHGKQARGRGSSEKVPDWVEVNHFRTWLRAPGILAGGTKMRGHRGLGAMAAGRGEGERRHIPRNPVGVRVKGQRQFCSGGEVSMPETVRSCLEWMLDVHGPGSCLLKVRQTGGNPESLVVEGLGSHKK